MFQHLGVETLGIRKNPAGDGEVARCAIVHLPVHRREHGLGLIKEVQAIGATSAPMRLTAFSACGLPGKCVGSVIQWWTYPY